MHVGVLFRQIRVDGLDQQLPTLRHRIAGVDYEVRNHLLDLPGVRAHVADIGGEVETQVDVFANETPEHFVEVPDQIVDAQHDRVEHLLAAEREQLAGEGRGPLRRPADFLHVFARVTSRRELLGEQVGVPEDRRQHIVEVVGQSPRQPPDGFHLLRLPELMLQIAPLGDVPHRGQQSPIREGPPTHLDDDHGAVLAQQRPFENSRASGRDFARSGSSRRPILGRIGVGRREAEQLVAAVSRHLAGARVDIEVVPVRHGDEHRVADVLQDGAVVSLTGSQRVLRALAVRDVHRQDRDALDRWLDSHLEPPALAVGIGELVLHHCGPARAHAALERTEHLGLLDAGIALHHRAPEQLFRRAAAVPRRPRTHVEVVPVEADDLEALVDGVDGGAEPRQLIGAGAGLPRPRGPSSRPPVAWHVVSYMERCERYQ